MKPPPPPASIAFIGGGNMASALIGGLLRAGRAPAGIAVVEPFEAQRDKLAQQFGVRRQAAPTPAWPARPPWCGP